MSARLISDRIRLWRWALVIGSTVLLNYFLWALDVGPAFAGVVVFLLLGEFIIFLGHRPTSPEWPIKLLLVGFLLIMVSSPTPAWDARTTWLFHAKRIFLSGDLYSQLDGYPSWSHSDYPALAAALSASLARWIGIWNEIFPKSANLFVAVPPILILASFLRLLSQKLLLVSGILLFCANNIVNGYMDGLLALHFTAAALITSALCGLDDRTEITPRESTWLVPLGVLVFAAMTLLKNEGALGLLVLTLVGSIFSLARRQFAVTWRLLAMSAIASLPLLLWKLACSRRGIATDLDQVGMAARFWNRLSNPGDVAEIAAAMLLRAEFIAPASLLLACHLLNRGRKMNPFPIVVSALYLLAVAAVYLATPADLAWHLQTSADRTVLPVTTLLSYLCVRQISNPALVQQLLGGWRPLRHPRGVD